MNEKLDGVDVLKEKINMCFILLLNKLETSETIEQTIYEHLDAFIEDWNKQLADKEQECKELEKNVEHWKSNFNGKVSAIEELIKIIRQALEDFSIEVGTPQYDRLLNGAKSLGIEVDNGTNP